MNLMRASVTLSVLTALSSCTAAEPASAGDAVLSIGAVQGKVSDQAAGLKHKSPRNKEEVTVQGVVTSRLLPRAKAFPLGGRWHCVSNDG